MFEEIENKLSDILKSNKALSRELEENQVNSEKDKNEIFLDVISILDVFTREEKVIADHSWNQSEDSQKAIKRLTNVKKKIGTILEKHGVKKILFEDGFSNDDLCTVTDTEPAPEHQNGYILSVEKEGYTRNGSYCQKLVVL